MTESRKVVFFDAEGTLYVPKKGRSFDDFWEGGEHTLERAAEHFRLNDGVTETLRVLAEKDYLIVVVSKHKEDLLPDLLERLGIMDFFADVIINGDKGDIMVNFLRKRDIPKDQAVIVGDIYEIDIKPAERVGIKGYLLGGDELGSISDIVHLLE
jgi:putative hydrolase of the HAD superfamily